jgi:K+/H+ antiporter YhaU regulatory subunit KhtT
MIRETVIYNDIKGIVVRIERLDHTVTNPLSDTILEKGDIICFVGEREKIKKHFG